MRVGIIGGGVAGLAAAYDLTAQGHYAEVFEVAPFLGGQASTFPVGGGQLERGYHHLFVSDTAITELIHELGLGDKLAWLESKVGLYHDGRIWDFSTPMDLLRFKPLSLWDRFRVGLWTLRLQRTADYAKFEDVTARDWLSQHMGRKAYEVLFEPLLRGKFGDHYDQVSMTWLWGKVRLRVASRGKTLQKERLGYPMGSFGDVIDTLAGRIVEQGGDVHTSAFVSKVRIDDNRTTGLEVQLGRDSAPEQRDYDVVIATTPSYVFTRLVPPMPGDYQEMLTGVNYLSAVLLILELDRPLTAKYWINIAPDPDTDGHMPFVGIIEHTNMIDKSLYGGKHIVYISNYPDRNSDLYKMEPGALLDLFGVVGPLRTPPPQAQPRLRPLLGTGLPPPPCRRRPAHHWPQLQPAHPAPPHARRRPLPGQHHPDIPRRPRHQLLHPHGPTSRSDGYGRRGLAAGSIFGLLPLPPGEGQGWGALLSLKLGCQISYGNGRPRPEGRRNN